MHPRLVELQSFCKHKPVWGWNQNNYAGLGRQGIKPFGGLCVHDLRSFRWNSILDAWKTALQLKPVLTALGTVTDTQWQNLEKAIIICEPVGVATDRIQGDTCNAVLLLKV
jgi:hypothetical protein